MKHHQGMQKEVRSIVFNVGSRWFKNKEAIESKEHGQIFYQDEEGDKSTNTKKHIFDVLTTIKRVLHEFP